MPRSVYKCKRHYYVVNRYLYQVVISIAFSQSTPNKYYRGARRNTQQYHPCNVICGDLTLPLGATTFKNKQPNNAVVISFTNQFNEGQY